MKARDVKGSKNNRPAKPKASRRNRLSRPAPGITRGDLYELWKRARRRNVDAQKRLYGLLLANPELETVLCSFAGQRDAVLKLRADAFGKLESVAETEWEREMPRSRLWVSIVSGGLPGLGKRR